MAELPRPQLFLIDGYALIYRAFFAMISRPLTTGKGENTSAAWGVANFLLRLRREYRPEYVAWVHDAGSSFRKETYPEYKATREKLDDELQDTFDRSLDRIEQLLAAFRVPLVAVDGYEADDVIGTLAARAAAEGIHAVIVSGDKDFYQLIDDGTSLLNPGRGGAAAVSEELVTMDNAAARLGVPPERVIDYLAMVGDSSDNVPGVKGVGDKTARQLIEDYGDLDSILAHAAEIRGKRAREALLAEADAAHLSRDLVSIHRDVPVDVSLDTLAAQDEDAEALRALFVELEFHSLVDQIGGGKAARTVAEDAPVVTLTDPAQLDAMVEAVRAAGELMVSTQGPFGDARRGGLDGLGIAAGDGAWYLPFGHRAPDGDLLNVDAPVNLPPLTDSAMASIVAVLEDPDFPKAGHNIKHDVLRLRTAGITMRGIAFDTMIASFLLDPGKRSHAMNALVVEHLGHEFSTYREIIGKGKSERPYAEVAIEDAARYAGTYARHVLRLRDHFRQSLKGTGLDALLRDLELPLIDVLIEMEWTGIRLDTDRLAGVSAEFRASLRQLEEDIHREAAVDFNINSTPQLRHVLFEKLQLPVLKKTKTGPSTDADVLAQLAGMGFEVPKLLLEYRELEKLRSTYLDALPRSVNPSTDRIHTTFNQVGAATGRLSSSDPNLQNIPVRTARGGEIRRCFVPDEGCVFVAADYSQIELRLLAHLSDDPAFIEAFERGGDVHRETAAIIFDVDVDDVTSEMRARAKTINFATIYGQGPFALARQLEISQDEAKEFIAKYFERFAGVRAYLDASVESARRKGYAETLFGRRRYIPELKEKNYNIRAFGERTAMNSPLQGSAADLIKRAMIGVHRGLHEADLGATVLLQVHDELVLEVPEPHATEASDIVVREMVGAATLKVPLVVDVGTGPNWLEAKQ